VPATSCVGSAPPVRRRARRGGTPAPALPRPAPHLRVPGDRASIVQVQAWMGHADAKTTLRYLHRKSRENEAELLADAFRRTRAPTGGVVALTGDCRVAARALLLRMESSSLGELAAECRCQAKAAAQPVVKRCVGLRLRLRPCPCQRAHSETRPTSPPRPRRDRRWLSPPSWPGAPWHGSTPPEPCA
jgi:hypothetical protein